MATSTFPPHLTEQEAAHRLQKFGSNELPQSKKQGVWARIVKLLREPILLLLVATGIVYLVMGDLSEGIMLGTSVFVVIGISYYQERKSEKALETLRELSSPRALVIRSGIERRVPARDLVPGDLIVLHEGDRVPADGVILQFSNLNIDESLLTGESVPVKKRTSSNEILDQDYSQVEENHFRVFSSTLVVSGTALVCVTKTGVRTEVGRVGQSLQSIEPEELSLSKEIRQIVRLFAWSGGILCVAIILIYGFSYSDWPQAFLVGLATQMSLLPEEFPVVLTIFLAMGAWRLSKVQVLIRRPSAIERLGAITVLCVDKTGTLTENRMTVAGIYNSKSFIAIDSTANENLPEDYHVVAEFGVLASHRDPFDPMEKAIRRMVEEGSWGKDHLHRDWEFIRDYPLSDQLFAMSCVWKSPDQNSHVIAAKGAPEAIADLCHLNEADLKALTQETHKMAKRGLRVLGVARSYFKAQTLPSHQHDFDFEWLGLIGLEDPLRPEVPKSVEQCRNAGIRVIMMTGDYPETALNIGARAGLDVSNSLLTGLDLKSLSDDELKVRLKTAHIFARMTPDQKLRIVKLLREMNQVVAMTGDGVNDAPSLKWADVGVAMGARGTDVAREASDIVLLDDNFTSIVAGIARGRTIFTNIKKAMRYIVSIHVPIAGLSILPMVLGWPLILSPIHIVFLELIIDPACSLMFEAQGIEEKEMNSPPRSLATRLFSARDLIQSTLQGIFILVSTLTAIWFSLQIGHRSPNEARALGFVVLTLGNLGLIFADMSSGRGKNLKVLFRKPSNIAIVLGLFACLLALTKIAWLSELFKFDLLHWTDLGEAVFFALLIFVVLAMWNWRESSLPPA